MKHTQIGLTNIQMQQLVEKLVGTMTMAGGIDSHDILYLHTFDDIREALESASLRLEGFDVFRLAKNSNNQKMFISFWGQKL